MDKENCDGLAEIAGSEWRIRHGGAPHLVVAGHRRVLA